MTFKSFVLLISLITPAHYCKEDIKVHGEKERAIGIHLGTTYSSVAVLKHPPPFLFYDICDRRYTDCSISKNSNIMELVPNDRGSRTTPSCVAFTDSGVMIGAQAKDQATFNPQQTICGLNTLIGKRFDDPHVQTYIKNFPYKVLNIENKPHVEVMIENGETKVFSPEEICAIILGKMKEIAEAYMGDTVEHAVVLVHPSYHNRVVQQHIKTAGKMLGLKVLYVGNSRHVALLTRRLWIRTIGWKPKVLVYHLGGSAFHVTLQDNDKVIACRGDTQLGGQAFETRVVDYFINLIKNKYEKDISKDMNALTNLRIECEKAKVSLSSSDSVMVKIEYLVHDKFLLFEEPLTRAMFEELNMDLFNKTIDLVRGVLNEGGVVKRDIDEIILVGGNTQIPKIQHMLQDCFGRSPLLNLKDVKPNEAMAFAAYDMAYGYSHKYDGRPYLRLMNSLNVGIETVGGIMLTFVGSGIRLPTTVFGFVTTYHDAQTTVEIKVFEGQRILTKYCHYLGTIILSDFPPAPRGVAMIKVEMEVDLMWNIRVTVEHKESKRIEYFTIPDEWRYNTVEKISQAHSEYSDFDEDDDMEKIKVEEEMRTLTMRQSHRTKFAIVVGHGF